MAKLGRPTEMQRFCERGEVAKLPQGQAQIGRASFLVSGMVSGVATDQYDPMPAPSIKTSYQSAKKNRFAVMAEYVHA
jgi:hypothetical protein